MAQLTCVTNTPHWSTRQSTRGITGGDSRKQLIPGCGKGSWKPEAGKLVEPMRFLVRVETDEVTSADE